jgi:hypothetical protein
MLKNRYHESLEQLVENSQSILDKAFDKTDEIVFQRFLEYIESSIAGYKRNKAFVLSSRYDALRELRDFINSLKKDQDRSFKEKFNIVVGFLLEEQKKAVSTKRSVFAGVLTKENSFFKLYDQILKPIIDDKNVNEYTEALHHYNEHQSTTLRIK